MTEEPGHSASAAPMPDPSGPGNVAVSDQLLWKQLGDAATLSGFTQAWLSLQCRMLEQARQGLVLLRTGEDTVCLPAAHWPESRVVTSELAAAAELAIEQRRGIVRRIDGREERNRSAVVLAYPILIDERPHGATAIEVAERAESRLGTDMRQLQWGTAWLRERLRKQHRDTRDTLADRADLALDILSLVLEQEHYRAACRIAVTELATRTQCERVSVGFVKNGYAEVATVSHSADFGKRMNLVRMLGAAMDEAIDQRAILRYPPAADDAPLVTRAHEELARAHGAGTILSIPVLLRDRYIGAFTFERPPDAPLESRTVELLTGVSALLGPLLDEKRQNDRWLIVKAGESARLQLARLLGPRHVARKLVAAVLLALLAFGFLATGTYRVAADARIEGRIQRALIAPFDGFIREAPARAGETVTEGTLLAALDERDLALARLKWVTERARNQHRYEQALSARERSEVNIIKTELQKADAQIALIDEQLARARIVAPFDGIVVAGDLSQKIGTGVRRGDPLFEVAPLDAYRVILEVDESQIADLAVGQRGELLTTSLPDTPFSLSVTRITPVAEANEGRNTFRVEAELEQTSTRLRPGMKGVSKIAVGERRLLWIWSRSTLDRLKLWLWRWLPS